MLPARNDGTMNIDIINEYNMLPAGCSVLCAVSGGADSMCLLHLLLSLRENLSIKVFAAHFEHGLRGEESLRDARFVENACAELGVKCVTEHGSVSDYARKNGLGTEEAARILRYDFLSRTAENLGCSRIATAHNADDNAETMLFNLCRGTGSTGLRGIPPVRGNIIRPLLRVSRREIELYLEKHGISHVEDSSNQSDDYSRNIIRHRITPVLKKLNPEWTTAAGKTAVLLSEDEDCLTSLADSFIRDEFDGESVSVRALASLHRAVASRVVRRLCKTSIGFDHVERVLSLCGGTELAYADIPGLRVRREQGRLYFNQSEKIEIEPRLILPDSVINIPELGVTVRAKNAVFHGEVNDLFKTYHLKYESICGNLYCTGRMPGDIIRPVGRNCSKSLKKLFSEKGLTQTERDKTLVFRDDAGVLAVRGLAFSERARPAEGDKIIQIEIETE